MMWRMLSVNVLLVLAAVSPPTCALAPTARPRVTERLPPLHARRPGSSLGIDEGSSAGARRRAERRARRAAEVVVDVDAAPAAAPIEPAAPGR